MQWVWDVITQQNRPMDVSGQKVQRTTRGFAIEPKKEEQEKQRSSAGGALTDAVWHSGLQRIFGVRGGYLLEFDKDGTLTRSLAYADPSMGDDYVVLNNGALWISHWYDPSSQFQDDDPSTERDCNKGFFVVDPALLSAATLYPFSNPSSASRRFPCPTVYCGIACSWR